jgi:hypothetical protein
LHAIPRHPPHRELDRLTASIPRHGVDPMAADMLQVDAVIRLA